MSDDPTARLADDTRPAAAPSGSHRVPGLDGLRGLAVIMVVLAHANIPFIRYGGITGVSLFFVLSGYLITTLLLTEWGSHAVISLRSFYARRALRLLPALVVALVGGVILSIAVGVSPGWVLPRAGIALFYVGNLQGIFHLTGGPFIHMWTLAMEEQFYLLWPLVLSFTLKWGRPVVIISAVALAISSLIFRFTAPIGTHAGYKVAYYLPHTNVYALLFGSIAALLIIDRPRGPMVSPLLWKVSLALFGFVATVPGMRDGLRESDSAASLISKIVVGPVAAVLGLVLVVAVATSGKAPAWLTSPTMLFFGRISYGLYLWHEILDWVIGEKLGRVGIPGLASGMISLVLAIGVAVLSFRYVETPFLRMKSRFERAALPS